MTNERKALIDKMLRTDVSNQFDSEYVSPARKREIAVCQAPMFMGCGHQLTESESDYYDNRRHLPRLCKRCVLEERAR